MKLQLLTLSFILFSTLKVNATITKTIGATGDYASITAAWTAIPTIESTITQPWILEIKGDYNTASETFPINLTAISGASSNNTITIRPQFGVSAFTISAASSIFNLTGCSYVTIDGRADGSGPIIMTFENTSSTASFGVVAFKGNTSYNTVTYCRLLNGGSLSYGVINFSSTNNNYNTVTSCYITNSTSGSAATRYGIQCYSGTSNYTTITNCNIYDFTTAGITCGASGSGSGWTISNNNFYLTSATTINNNIYAIYLGSTTATGNATITGNFIGGQAATCSGSAMDITSNASSYGFTGIYVKSNSAAVTISSNTVQNISMTCNVSLNFSIIEISGSSSFTVGSLGNGNVIGSTSGTNSITMGGTGSPSFSAIYENGKSGNNSIAYNQMGGIIMNSSTGNLYFFRCSSVASTGNCSYTNNTIGNSTSNNISISADAACNLFYFTNSTGTHTLSDNEIQNIISSGNTSASSGFIAFRIHSGIVIANNNSVHNIAVTAPTPNSNSTFVIFYISTNGAHSITNNSCYDLSSTLYYRLFDINSTVSYEVNSNLIGNTNSNNIISTYGGLSTPMAGIYCAGTGATITCNNNTVQNFQINSNTFTSSFSIIQCASGTFNANNNSIKNINSNSQGNIYGIQVNSTANHQISSNSIESISAADRIIGISIATSSSASITVNSNTIGSTSTNNLTTTYSGSSYQYGIYLSGTSNYTCDNNTIQQFYLNNTSSTSSFSGIYCSNGTITATTNTIQNITSTSSGTLYGIWTSTGSNHIITDNDINNFTTNGYINGIYITGLTSGSNTINSNTIGNSTSNNMSSVATGSSVCYGIYLSGTSTNTCNDNIIQQFSITNTSSSTDITAISVSSGAAITASNNVIQDLVATSSNSSIYGIQLTGTGTHTVTYNAIQNITNIGDIRCIYNGCNTNCTISNNTIGGTNSNNISSSGSGISNYGIFSAATSSTHTCNENIIQNIAIPSSTFYAIYSSSGILSATSNEISNNSASTFVGIQVTSNLAHSVSNNIIQNSTSTGSFTGIYISNGSGTYSNNTIGGSTSNNITNSGTTSNGIRVSTGSSTIVNNTIQNWNLTNTGSSTFNGILSNGNCTIMNNTISNITSTSTNTTTAGGSLALNGITLNASGNNVYQNTISNLSITSTGTGSYSATGINSQITSSATNTLKKNKITNLSTAANSNSAVVAGILVQGASNGVIGYNNVIILNNGSSNGRSVILNGIRVTATGTSTLYHNTAKIYGTVTSGTGSSAAFYNGGSNTINLKNNLFQNLRSNSGSTGKHYAIQYATIPTTVTAEDYNYLHSSGSGGYIGYYSSDRLTLSNWQTASGTGSNDNSGTSLDLDSDGVPTNGSSSDVQNTGIDLTTIVPDDYNGSIRATPNPWRGAYEADQPIALSSEFIDFTATYLPPSNTVTIQWTTNLTSTIDLFAVEKSIDGKNFIQSSSINRNTDESNHYEVIDYFPIQGINYYRIKETMLDGSFNYSETKSIYCETDQQFQVLAFPNPSTIDQTQIVINSKSNSMIELELSNLQGEVYYKNSFETSNHLNFQLQHIIPAGFIGILLLKVDDGKRLSTTRIIIK